MPQPCWEKYSGLLEEEIQRLEEAGFRCKVDEELKQRGLLSLNLVGTIEGKEINLEARYPEHYPYFRPEVFTDDFRLIHHQNPRAGNLCLLERSTTVWHTNYSLAGLLEKNLKKTIRAGTAMTIEETGIEEVPQPEPISEYMTFTQGGILFDGSWEIPSDIDKGILHISLISTNKSFVAAINTIEDDKGNCVTKADERLNENIQDILPIAGRWIRIQDIKDFTDNLQTMDPSKLMKKIERIDRELIKTKGAQYDIIGLLFREETERRKEGDGWIFILRNNIQTLKRRGKKGNKITPKVDTYYFLIRGSRAGWEDLKARVPIRDHLRSKKITLIGAGCIGAPIAFELARAGAGELRIMDSDTIEAGNAVRWPLGFSSVGTPKVIAVKEFIRQNISYTKVIPKIGRVGGVEFPSERTNGQETHGEMLESILQDTDLIIDASGEDGVNHFLSELAGERKIPIIFVATTVGTWGGDIVRIIPGETKGCWACYGYLQKEGKLPKPPKDPSPEAAEIYPRGCAAPTFTGNQFDATFISMACVRTAIGILLREPGGYPLNDNDVTTIRLRDSEGTAIMPVFESYPLECHEQCKSNLH